ncbi:sensor histidine kinase [Streptomyces sp. 7N604]|uniref:sensor histidine kinase n=1 Tax=Streptomyces sp. 7N604 TaxID=3457415 RepID=UPI003FD18863
MPEPPTYAARPESGRPIAAAPTGKRHGRPPAHETAADSATRARLVRLAVLPAALVSVLSAAVVIFVLRSQEGYADAATWGVLTGAAVLGAGVLLGGAIAGDAEARTVSRRLSALRRSGARAQSDLQELLQRLGRGERLQQRPFAPLPRPEGDTIDLLAHELTLAQRQAEAAVVQATQLVRGTAGGSEEKVEVFVNLARRLQSLVHREIELLDELENEVEDPDLLKGLFHVDHLATRIRRHAENLAVLGGAISRRQWSRPVTMTEVLRSSIAEVEQYSRVKLVPPIEGTLRGHAVADVIHLLAELVENATVFSAPQTQVLLRAQKVTAGLAVEVEDRGLGMPREEQMRMNALLADPDHIDVGKLLQDGRIGLFVVSALARRHGILVQLQSNIYGGVQAVLVVPQGLLGDEASEAHQAAADGGAQPAAHPPAHQAAAPAAPTAPSVQQPAAQPAVAPSPPLAHPQPEPLAMPTPIPQQHARAMEPAAPRDRGPALPHDREGTGGAPNTDARDERPQLPRRRRQEHLVPELRDTPTARSTGDEREAEHDPGLMAAFRRGFSLAETPDASDESPADSSR